MTGKNRTLSLMGGSAVALLAVAAGTGPAAHAGTLGPNPLQLTTGAGTSSAIAVTTAPNNFPTATPSSNSVTMSTTFTGIGSVDSVLQGTASGGTTEYLFTVTTTDNTPSAFSSLLFEIGRGTGANFVVENGGPVTFAGDPAFPASIATSTKFSSASQYFGIDLTYSVGSVAAGSNDRETFTLAVPDTSAFSAITLREIATAAAPVPEASSVVSFGLLLLFGAGGLCLTAQRRKREAAE